MTLSTVLIRAAPPQSMSHALQNVISNKEHIMLKPLDVRQRQFLADFCSFLGGEYCPGDFVLQDAPALVKQYKELFPVETAEFVAKHLVY